MTTGNTMQVDPMVALQEANAREEFFKQRNLFLAQSHASAAAEIARLNARIDGLEADLRLARGEEDEPIDGGSE
ncbi:hypothetical protein FOB41_09790 [Agrobacterium pusense]|uniref:Uncharacterized protein n=1 Tax=Agrobacterium pusense TaxID=648995 RepID=A0A6H0ZKQ9_9HYPH|nr:hypothetical protein [Agrobacterium pusense]QIX21406.1 hypothetical protein FOB41_09790 [Agrobacterium pusense]